MATRKKAWDRRGNDDADVVKARGRLGAAIQNADPDAAAQAARELTEARRVQRIRDHEREAARLRGQDEALVAGGEAAS